MSRPAPLRIAIVNDLAMAREALRRVVLAVPGTEIAWMAENGAEALQRAISDRPDLVLMDLIMPVMDGVECTRRIMREAPCPVVVVTATVEGNASRVYDAIGAGALDAVETPRLSPDGARGERPLVEKIEAVRRMRAADAPGAGATQSPIARAAGAASSARPGAACPIIAVGASTGGPQAVATLLDCIPNPAPAGVVVVQHMDPHFLPGLATWLAGRARRSVRLALAGDRPDPSAVLLAGEARQLVMRADGALDYVDGDPAAVHCPSVDAFFESLAAARAGGGVAVLLTGMGRDGAAGLLALRRAGWPTYAQDRDTSVVWGMPGAAHAMGAVERLLPLGELGPAMLSALAARRKDASR
jgi:two-component system response regulator WspF